ncbi:acyltransferase family protein [Pantoea sp. FN0307]|uniref:acyltransferase family protein n=1 Tax=Pantoea sp. FN0307 TaxID=3418560 RepID=UPI003CF3E738
MSQIKYRPDIDGLRALAVLLVVLYHAKFPIPGGFVGVDVFFVISGFLITRIIDKEIRESQFTYTSFYVRRVKRLIPALFFMLMIVSVYCSYYLMPDDLMSYGKTALLSLLGVSNFYFYWHTNYFESSSFEPLLHTWSLAVEEQYYIFWPVILMAANKVKKRGVKAVVFCILFFASVFLSWYYVNQDKNLAYMMLPFRFFELMSGALLAINLTKIEMHSKLNDITSVLGLSLIIGSAFLLNDNSSFPGISALPVTLGSTLLIASSGGIVNRMLSFSPVVYIGRVSYSFYLWHWPFIILAVYRGIELDTFNASLLVLAAFLMSCISYHFIENPFRRLSKAVIVFPAVYVLPLCCAYLFMVYLNNTSGMKWRIDGMFNELDDKNSAHIVRSACTEKMKIGNINECWLGVKKDTPDALMIGDSFGNAATPFIDVLAKNAGIMVTDTMRSTTPSLPGVYVSRIDKKMPDDEITRVLKYTRDRIEYARNVKMVIISDYFDQYNEKNPTFRIYNANGEVVNDKVFAMREQVIRDLLSKGVKVFIVARPFKAIGRNEIARLRALKMRHVLLSSVLIKPKEPRNERVEYRLKRKFPEITIIDFNDVLCNAEGCSPFVNGDIIFRKDGGHLNYTSAAKIGALYLEEFKNPLAIK